MQQYAQPPLTQVDFTKPGLPKKFEGDIILGAEHSHLIDNFGQAVTQSVATDKAVFTRRQITWHVLQPIQNHFECTPGLFTHVVANAGIEEVVKGVGSISCGADHFYSLVGSSYSHSLSTQEPGEYTITSFWWSAELLREILYEDPALREAINNCIPGYPEKIIAPPLKVTREIKELMNELFAFDYTSGGAHKFLHERMKRLVRLILKESRELKEIKIKFKNDTWQRIVRAKTIIEQEPFNVISDDELGRKVGLGATSIKDGIKAITGSSYQEYRKSCMFFRVGRRIIVNHEQIKEIFRETGYTSISTFTRAFKTIFWCTPSELGKQKWKTDNNYVMTAEDKFQYGTLIARFIGYKINPSETEQLNTWLLFNANHLSLFEQLIDDDKTEWTKQWFNAAGVNYSFIQWTNKWGWDSMSRNVRETILFYGSTIILSIYFIWEYLQLKHQ